jgi:hypothetical protein
MTGEASGMTEIHQEAKFKMDRKPDFEHKQ